MGVSGNLWIVVKDVKTLVLYDMEGETAMDSMKMFCLLCLNGLLFYFINDTPMSCEIGDLEAKMRVYTAAGSGFQCKGRRQFKELI